MKKQFNYLDGVITIDTANGKITATITDADGTTTPLEDYTAPGELTEAQKEAISRRFGEPKEDGQPF